MKNFIFLSFVFCLFSSPVYCEENNSAQQEIQKSADEEMVSGQSVYYTHYADMPKIKELDEKDDDLYSGEEVLPMNIQLSEEEKQQDLSLDFDYIDSEYELPDLSCDNEKLTKEVARFIQDNTDVEENSVISRRNRLLLVKNLNKFSEISEDDISNQDNFKTKATLMYLRINRNQTIHKICVSKNNRFGKYNNIFLVIYPYLKYYKIVVTNMISIPEKMDNSTFIHSW
ncbi:MAG: hypothetical protein IJ677_08365 [Alphaproteobacteria bacterium]|nr:hypothetical protein [Alphaproteobacteria bacterium]